MKTIEELKRRRDRLNVKIARLESIIVNEYYSSFVSQYYRDQFESDLRLSQAAALKTIPVRTPISLLLTLNRLRRAVLNNGLKPVRFEMTAQDFRRLNREQTWNRPNVFDDDHLLNDDQFATKWSAFFRAYGLPVSIIAAGRPRIVSE